MEQFTRHDFPISGQSGIIGCQIHWEEEELDLALSLTLRVWQERTEPRLNIDTGPNGKRAERRTAGTKELQMFSTSAAPPPFVWTVFQRFQHQAVLSTLQTSTCAVGPAECGGELWFQPLVAERKQRRANPSTHERSFHLIFSWQVLEAHSSAA